MRKLNAIIAIGCAVLAAGNAAGATTLYYWSRTDGNFETLTDWRASDSSQASAAPAEIGADSCIGIVRNEPYSLPLTISANRDYALDGFRISSPVEQMEVVFDLGGNTFGCGYLCIDFKHPTQTAVFSNGTVNVTYNGQPANREKSVSGCFHGNPGTSGGNLTIRDATVTTDGGVAQTSRRSILKIENSTVNATGTVKYDANPGEGEYSAIELTGSQTAVTAEKLLVWGNGGGVVLSDGASLVCGDVMIGNYSTRSNCRLTVDGTKFVPTGANFIVGNYSRNCALEVTGGGEVDFTGRTLKFGIGNSSGTAGGALISVDGGTLKAAAIEPGQTSTCSTNRFRNATVELANALTIGRSSSEYGALVVSGERTKVRTPKLAMGCGAMLRFELPGAGFAQTPIVLSDRAALNGTWTGEGGAVRLELETTEFDKENSKKEITLVEFKNFTESNEAGRQSRAFAQTLLDNCTIATTRPRTGKVVLRPSEEFSGVAGAMRLAYVSPAHGGLRLIIR